MGVEILGKYKRKKCPDTSTIFFRSKKERRKQVSLHSVLKSIAEVVPLQTRARESEETNAIGCLGNLSRDAGQLNVVRSTGTSTIISGRKDSTSTPPAPLRLTLEGHLSASTSSPFSSCNSCTSRNWPKDVGRASDAHG